MNKTKSTKKNKLDNMLYRYAVWCSKLQVQDCWIKFINQLFRDDKITSAPPKGCCFVGFMYQKTIENHQNNTRSGCCWHVFGILGKTDCRPPAQNLRNLSPQRVAVGVDRKTVGKKNHGRLQLQRFFSLGTLVPSPRSTFHVNSNPSWTT